MQLARILKCLAVSVPALVAGLTLACADGDTATAPDMVATIDDDGSLGCANGYALATAPRGDYWDAWDFNGNDHVCRLISFVD